MTYTAAGTLVKQDRTERVQSNTGVGVFQGSMDVTNYNSALLALTFVTGRFQSTLAVLPELVTDEGYTPQWVGASNSFKLWKATGNAAAATELGEDVDAGGFNFLGIGLV